MEEWDSGRVLTMDVQHRTPAQEAALKAAAEAAAEAAIEEGRHEESAEVQAEIAVAVEASVGRQKPSWAPATVPPPAAIKAQTPLPTTPPPIPPADAGVSGAVNRARLADALLEGAEHMRWLKGHALDVQRGGVFDYGSAMVAVTHAEKCYAVATGLLGELEEAEATRAKLSQDAAALTEECLRKQTTIEGLKEDVKKRDADNYALAFFKGTTEPKLRADIEALQATITAQGEALMQVQAQREEVVAEKAGLVETVSRMSDEIQALRFPATRRRRLRVALGKRLRRIAQIAEGSRA